MTPLTNRTALVTGGGSGIGLAVARAFLEHGARVAITGRQETRLRQAAESLHAGDRLFLHPADLAQVEQVKGLVHRVEQLWGPVDVLVNNAGLNIRRRAFRELSPEDWQLLMRMGKIAAQRSCSTRSYRTFLVASRSVLTNAQGFVFSTY